jgi:hypothetical protein
METLTIELIHPKAVSLLKELEEMHILKVISSEKTESENKPGVRLGGLKDKGLDISEDFNAPLDDLKEYMY